MKTVNDISGVAPGDFEIKSYIENELGGFEAALFIQGVRISTVKSRGLGDTISMTPNPEGLASTSECLTKMFEISLELPKHFNQYGTPCSLDDAVEMAVESFKLKSHLQKLLLDNIYTVKVAAAGTELLKHDCRPTRQAVHEFCQSQSKPTSGNKELMLNNMPLHEAFEYYVQSMKEGAYHG